jgi:hypothetical protein
MLTVGNFEIKATLDEDGHLTVWVASSDGSPVIDVGEDVAGTNEEFAVRLSTEAIEHRYIAESGGPDKETAKP